MDALSPRKILGSQENYLGLHNNIRPGDSHYHHGHTDDFDSKSQENDEPNQTPPKPPRSAFMCFTDNKRQEILSTSTAMKKSDVLKIVAEEWRKLSDQERAYWDEEAREDKVRFVREKAAFRGIWAVPKRRAKKHPLAPKRPMSAFLKFSQTRRAKVKADNPDISNTDVSRLLGEAWRNASSSERAPYIEDEQRERAAYKEEIRKFRENQSKLDSSPRYIKEEPRRDTQPIAPAPYHMYHHDEMMHHGDQRLYRPYSSVPPLPPPPPPYDVKHSKYRSYESSRPEYGRSMDPPAYRYQAHPAEEPLPLYHPVSNIGYHGQSYAPPFRTMNPDGKYSLEDHLTSTHSHEESPGSTEPYNLQGQDPPEEAFFDVESPGRIHQSRFRQPENDFLSYHYP